MLSVAGKSREPRGDIIDLQPSSQIGNDDRSLHSNLHRVRQRPLVIPSIRDRGHQTRPRTSRSFKEVMRLCQR
jgi:hypothetical protein